MDAAAPSIPEAAIEHISQMLTLAKSKHREAMALLTTPDPNALSRLREALQLLQEVELLADDASTYVGADVMKAAIKDLHFQQAAVQTTIAQFESEKVHSPWSPLLRWFALVIFAIVVARILG